MKKKGISDKERSVVEHALDVELFEVILAHEIDIHNNSKKIWLESAFMLVIQALKNSSIVPWSIRYRWENNLLFCKLNLIVSLSSNVYKERNFYAHALANHKASSKARFTRLSVLWQLYVKQSLVFWV